MSLDKRQRAMLREMGVRVWQPDADAVPEPVAAPIANESIPASAIKPVAERTFDAKPPVKTPAASTRPPQPPTAVNIRPEARPEARPETTPDTGMAAWSLGEAQALYADTAKDGARWLVLAEAPASALQAPSFNPFEGDAGKLLDNMLRAAHLNKAGAALLAPLVRRSAADGADNLLVALPGLIASARPDVVLVMGRLAAQALLQSSEPFAKLRGQVHALHGIKTIVTHDAAYLLRTQLDKAKAWDDLCLAMSVVKAV